MKNPPSLFRKLTPIVRKPSPSFLKTPGGFSENTYPILPKPRGLYACGGRFFCIRWGNRRGNFVVKPRRRRHFHRARIPQSPPNPGSETTELLPPASVSLRKDHPPQKTAFLFSPLFCYHARSVLFGTTTVRKGGRVVECAGLEIRYTVIPYRGFESLPFRHPMKKARDSRAFVLCAFRAFSNTGAPSNDFPICFVVCHRVS